MAELTHEIADFIRTACVQGADEAAGALSRALDQSIQFHAGTHAPLDRETIADDLAGAGLALIFQAESSGALLLLSDASGLLPAWYASPDAAEESKLNTLAQELSLLVFPDVIEIHRYAAISAPQLAEMVEKSQVAESARHLPLTLSSGDRQATMHLIWPIADPGAVLPQQAGSPATFRANPAFTPAKAGGAEEAEDDPFAHLPPYTRSMLRIQVPVMVTLASKKQSINKIVELGPGSIIKFDKLCDEMLELEVGGRPIAEGEAVKVGDKFGLRISSMILPGERFERLARRTTVR